MGYLGDLPILFVKIEDVNDMHIIYDILKAHEFFRTKNIKVDLIILNLEMSAYEQYVKYEIENAILNEQVEYLKNINGGIYVINRSSITDEDINLLTLRANLIIDANLGKIETQLKDLEEDYIKSLSNIGNDVEVLNNIEEEKVEGIYEDLSLLKYYNEYGGFSEDGLEYHMKINKSNKLPIVWSMILANENFGTLVTQNLGGFTWNYNSRLNRLTAWNNNPLIDIPSEIIYLKDTETGKVWSLSENMNNQNQDYYITYGFGYIKQKTLSNNLLQELEIFVPRKEGVKVNILKLKNTISNKRKIKLIYYIKPVLRRR